MGLFDKWKKKRHPEEIPEEFTEPERPQDEGHKAQHEALACCEQLIELTRELEDSKKEYRLVTDYLNDIQLLEGLPDDEMENIKETAQNIQNLTQTKDQLVNREKRLSDVQFAQMEQLEDEMPDDIRRMQTNESYQSMIRRDIDNLEGEKSEWEYYMQSIQREQKILRVGIWVLFALFIVGVGVFGYYGYVLYRDVSLPSMLFIFVVALLAMVCFLRMQYNRKERSRANASINRAITLLNQMKAKYVNATNAVDYACEKFHVRNSMELSYLWDLYQQEVEERDNFIKTDEDLAYFSTKLERDLRKYNMYDASIWAHQVNALLDKKEMVEVKHYMLVRRQKLRSRMEKQVNDIQDTKGQLVVLVRNDKEHRAEIMEVLRSVDKMCGV